MATQMNSPNLVGLQKTISNRLTYRRQKSKSPTTERNDIGNKAQKNIERKKGFERVVTRETSTDTLISSFWNVLGLRHNDESDRSIDTSANTARTAETLTSRDSQNFSKSTNDIDDLNFDYSDFVEELIRKSQSTFNGYDNDGDEDDDCRSVDSDEEVVSCKLKNYVIDWSDISFPSHIPSNKIIIGKGSYGTVLRALWTKGGVEKEVAIKIQTIPNTKTKSDFHKVRSQTKREVQVMITARDNVPDKNVVTEAYGMIEGCLPPQIASLLKRTNPDDKAVGIVMEYESGGSLEQYLSQKRSSAKSVNVIPLKEKFRLLVEIARSIQALHSVGIVHADIKAANVLLSGDILHPRPRLSDFGMSVFRQEVNIFEPRLSVQLTSKRSRGTRAFCAPEMLVNPYKQGMLKTNMMGDKEAADFLNTIAKPSRTTDMYAFGLLAWQILTQRQPFVEITSEAMLVSKVHKDYRPDVNKCPPETPKEVIAMIQSCWHGDREKRKTAGECSAILQRHYLALPYVNPTDESTLNINGVNSLMSSQETDIIGAGDDNAGGINIGEVGGISSSSVFKRHVIDQLLLHDDDEQDNHKNSSNKSNSSYHSKQATSLSSPSSPLQAPFLSRIKRLSKTNSSSNNNNEDKSHYFEFENYLSDFSENERDDDIDNNNSSSRNHSNNNSYHSITTTPPPPSPMIEVKKQSNFVSKNITFFNSLRISPNRVSEATATTAMRKSPGDSGSFRRFSSFHPSSSSAHSNSSRIAFTSTDYKNMTNYNFASSSSSSSSSSVKSIVAAINAGKSAISAAAGAVSGGNSTNNGNGTSARSTNNSPTNIYSHNHNSNSNSNHSDGSNVNSPPYPEHLQPRPLSSGNSNNYNNNTTIPTTINPYTITEFSIPAATTATTTLTPEQVLEREQHQYDLMRTSFRGNALVVNKRPVSSGSNSNNGSRNVSRSSSTTRLHSANDSSNTNSNNAAAI